MKVAYVPLTAVERRMCREALAQLLAGESDFSQSEIEAAESALVDKLNKRSAPMVPLSALKLAVKLLRAHAEPTDLGGSRFDLTDCEQMRPIFDAIAKATGGAQ